MDNRIHYPPSLIDFSTTVGTTGQAHDTYPAPGQARYDWLRISLIGLLSNQSSTNPPTQFREGTLWFNTTTQTLNIAANRINNLTGVGDDTSPTFDTVAKHINLETGLNLWDWYQNAKQALIITSGTKWDPVQGKFVAATVLPTTVNGVLKGDGTGVITAAVDGVDYLSPLGLNNPTLTGTPTAPTPPPGDNSNTIATTKFVTATITGATLTVSQIPDAAPLLSPNFTGTPTSPTRPASDNTTALATTAYVDRQVAAPRYALQFPNTPPYSHVNHGPFWGEPFTATGTVGILNGGNLLTGAGTKFMSEIVPRQWYYLGADATKTAYRVLYVIDDTTLIIASNYTGTTVMGGSQLIGCLGTGCWWELWLAPTTLTGNILVDGTGSAHAIQLGMTNGVISGSMWNGTGAVPFAGQYITTANEWIHTATRWDGTAIYQYINGVLDAVTPFPGPRIPAGIGNNAGVLYVGGSTSNNLAMKLAMVRGWDNVDPTTAPGPLQAFVPERTIGLTNVVTTTGVAADFVCDYTMLTRGILPDLSAAGYLNVPNRGRIFHHGRRFQASPDTSLGAAPASSNPFTGPVPEWISDPDCPFGQILGSTPSSNTISKSITFSGTPTVADDFNRPNQTFAFQATPVLGDTTIGNLTWQTATPNSWGLLGGTAVPLGLWPTIAWVDNPGGATMDVRVAARASGILYLGIAFRVVDKDNYLALICLPDAGANYIYLGYRQDGTWTQTNVSGAIGSFTQLRVVASGSTINCYYDAVNVFGAVTNSVFATATGAGLAAGPNQINALNQPVRVWSFAIY